MRGEFGANRSEARVIAQRLQRRLVLQFRRLDGTGYPLGLGAMDIGRETRIITVCDFYDALTADRPYRAAMPRDQALAIIEGEIDGAIDPECYEAMRSIV